MNRNICVNDDSITFDQYRRMRYEPKPTIKVKSSTSNIVPTKTPTIAPINYSSSSDLTIHEIIDVANNKKKIKSLKKRKKVTKELLIEYLKLNYSTRKRRFNK